jgi:hypothetical protein
MFDLAGEIEIYYMIIISFLTTLILTILIEETVVFLLGYRNKNTFLVVALVNIITNPIANYIVIINNIFNIIRPNISLVIVLEILIIYIEWKILEYALPNQEKQSFLFFSIMMNLASFLTGIILFGLP